MRKILITNDDGIAAGGLRRLAETARRFGEVWVVAPERQRSAAAHSITLNEPIDVWPIAYPVEGVHAYACSGTPGDCVRVGALAVMPEKPEAVLSGINYGHNVAADIQYSATAGAAFEAAFQGLTAIAISEDASELHETTDAYLPYILESLLAQEHGPDQIWNVNFPGCPLEECQGILRSRTVSRAIPYTDSYRAIGKLEKGGTRYVIEGEYQEKAEEGSDFHAVVNRYISIGIVTNIS